MLLAVMGSGSHLKRPWDDTEHDTSQNQHVGPSTSATQSGRRFSIDPPIPVNQRLPPILTTHERPSQVLRMHSWTTNADADETFACSASPRPHVEGSAKRPRLFYDRKESASAERFIDFRSSTTHGSVRTSACLSSRDSAILYLPARGTDRECIRPPIQMNNFDTRQHPRPYPSKEWRTGMSSRTPHVEIVRIQNN